MAGKPKTKTRKRYYDDDDSDDDETGTSLSKFLKAVDDIRAFHGKLTYLKLEEVTFYLTVILGQENVNFLLYLIKYHVPRSFPNRSHYVRNIYQATVQQGDTDTDRLDSFIQCLLKHEENIDVDPCDYAGKLWKAATKLKDSCMKFYLPNITECQKCHCKTLYSSTKSVTNITVYTLQGPIPCKKAALVCRKCNTYHSLTGYKIGKEKRLFKLKQSHNLIYGSNKVYITRRLHEFVCESR